MIVLLVMRREATVPFIFFSCSCKRVCYPATRLLLLVPVKKKAGGTFRAGLIEIGANHINIENRRSGHHGVVTATPILQR